MTSLWWWWSFCCWIPLTVLGHALSEHQVLFTVSTSEDKSDHQSQIELSTAWSCLGPVPAGMREQSFGANPLAAFGHPISWLKNSTKPKQSTEWWLPDFSTYRANDTSYSQSTFFSSISSQDGHRQTHSLTVAFPDIRWNELRNYQGWAALQWQAYLSSSLSVDCGSRPECAVSISLERGNEFALVPTALQNENLTEVKWYRGDWYSYNEQFPSNGGDASPSEPPYPHRIRVSSGEHMLVIRAVYEDRIFGDPWDDRASDGSPEVKLTIDIGLDQLTNQGEQSAPRVLRVLKPDIVNGRFAGWGLAVDLLNTGTSPLTISSAGFHSSSQVQIPLSASIPTAIRLEGDQTRIIPVRVEQIAQLSPWTNNEQTLVLSLHGLDHNQEDVEIKLDITLRHVKLEAPSDLGESSRAAGAFTFTYLSELGGVEVAVAVAPSKLLTTSSGTIESIFDARAPAVLLLHGAGVDVLEPVWARSFPRQDFVWAVLPQGSTPWGFDWQLNSHIVARNALQALSTGARSLFTSSPNTPDIWVSRSSEQGAINQVFNPHRTIVLGHSNGGQGAWHYITKHSKEVVAGVVAAGYIKMGDYVGFDWHVGRQHTDPALNGILRASLSSFENDLHASNAVGIPLLVKYGEGDTNVPTWHSRSMASLIASWNRLHMGKQDIAPKLVSVSAIPNKPHWWDEIFLESDVVDFLAAHTHPSEQWGWEPPSRNAPVVRISTLDPSETGPVGQWLIRRVVVPGRLGRLTATLTSPNHYVIEGVNVDGISFIATNGTFNMMDDAPPPRVQIGKTVFDLTDHLKSDQVHDGNIYFSRDVDGTWASSLTPQPLLWSRPMGPMIRALNSSGPLQIILPSRCDKVLCERYRSVAKRFAQSVLLFGRVDSEFMLDSDVIGSSSDFGRIVPNSLGPATVVVLGGPAENLLARFMNSSKPLPLFIDDKVVRHDKDIATSPCLGFTTLAPHPVKEHDRSLAISVWGNNVCGIEVAGKLLPVTTGSQVPEYVVLDGTYGSWQGAGGILAAGWYSQDWKFSPSMAFP